MHIPAKTIISTLFSPAYYLSFFFVLLIRSRFVLNEQTVVLHVFCLLFCCLRCSRSLLYCISSVVVYPCDRELTSSCTFVVAFVLLQMGVDLVERRED